MQLKITVHQTKTAYRLLCHKCIDLFLCVQYVTNSEIVKMSLLL